jgi:hypothetical protein
LALVGDVMVTVLPDWVKARSWKFWSLLKPCVTDPLRTSVTRWTGLFDVTPKVPV